MHFDQIQVIIQVMQVFETQGDGFPWSVCAWSVGGDQLLHRLRECH